MNVAEFRSAVGSRDLASIGEATGRSARTIRAYWYGYRHIPADVERFVRDGDPTRRQVPTTGTEHPDTIALRAARSEAKRHGRDAERFRASIARMCAACEPDEPVCRDETCALRSVSPYPLSATPFPAPLSGGPLAEGEAGKPTPRDWPPRSHADIEMYGWVATRVQSPEGPAGGDLV